MGTRRLVVCMGVVAILIGGAACSSSSSSGGKSGGSGATPSKPLVIDSILAQSGPIASVGDAMLQGEKAALAVINGQGGVFGKPVQIKVFDDAGDPTQAVSKVQTLISQGGVQVVQAGTISAEIAATVPVLTQAKIFTVDHGIDPTLNNTSKYPYAYSDGYLPDAPSVALAAEFAKLGYKKVGLVTDTTAGGIAAIASDKTAFSAKGISLVTAQVPAGAVTATSQFEQVLAEKPDVLLLDSYGAAAAPIMKTRAELMPKIPTFGGQLLAANDLGSIAPASAYKGMKILSIAVAVKGSAQTQTPAFKKFFAALLKVTGGKIIFTMNTYVVAYDDIIVAATAAKLAKSTSAQAMSNAMNHVTAAQMPDYVGPISFTTTNHFPLFGPSYWTFFSYGPIVDGQFVSSGS